MYTQKTGDRANDGSFDPLPFSISKLNKYTLIHTDAGHKKDRYVDFDAIFRFSNRKFRKLLNMSLALSYLCPCVREWLKERQNAEKSKEFNERML